MSWSAALFGEEDEEEGGEHEPDNMIECLCEIKSFYSDGRNQAWNLLSQ